MTTPITPTTPTVPTGSARTTRRWGIPLAFAGGAAAVALAGAAAFAGQTAAAADPLMVRGEHAEHAGHGPDRAMRMQARAEVDPAVRGQHVADLAQRLGVDVDELTATIEAFRADRAVDHEALREQLAELEPTERRDAMRAFAAERRAAMAAALGVDVEVLAELHAETRDGAGHERGPRGPQAARMGPHARG
jgi:hypothetical protein